MTKDMSIKEQVIALWKKNFEEVLEEKCKCPECKQDTLIRHITKETSQKWAGRWFVEYCGEGDCPYWDCGFLGKGYKPKEEYKWIPEVPIKPRLSKEDQE